MSQSRADRFVSYSIGLAALVIAVLSVYRTFVGPRQVADGVVAPTLIEGWEEGLPFGRHVAGSVDAPITIVEFTDLECSACRGFQARLDSVLISKAGKVKLVYIPFPLAELHRFAIPAARFAECASRDGKLGAWISAVYDSQDSLGLKSWASIAASVGIADTSTFVACAQTPAVDAEVAGGIAFGRKIEIAATPTVLVQGWRFAKPPTVEMMERMIDGLTGDTVLSGRVR